MGGGAGGGGGGVFHLRRGDNLLMGLFRIDNRI